MNVLLRKHFWIFNLAVITASAYLLASSLNSCIVLGKLPVVYPKPSPRSDHLAPVAAQRISDVSSILARNIFCSTCEPAAEVAVKKLANTEKPGEGGQTGDGSAIKSSLTLRLIATLVSDKDKAWSFAALLHPEDNKTRLYGIGQKLFGLDATVVDVLDRRVLLSREGHTEYIDLDQGNRRTSSSLRATPRVAKSGYKSAFSRFTKSVSSGIKKVGPNKYEIRRSALNKVLGNTTMLARSARIVPSARNGKPNGFKLYAIRPGSVYSLIGMQNGDTIHAINGRSITTPDKALAVYTQVRNASHLTIAFTRRGKAVTNDFTIR